MRDSTAWALHTGDLVQPQQVVMTGVDGWGIFQVSDGSKFEVFPNSKIVFRATRSEWKDLLEVWLGKVRVQIEHFGTVPNNNRIHTPSAVIAVRGTIFDVTVDDEGETTLVQDEEGSVSVRHLLRPGPEKILAAGESVLIYKNSPLAKSAIDKGAVMQRVARAASDAFYQLGLNGQRATASIPKVPTGNPGDKNNAPPPPPTAPPPPPPPPPQ
jgi:ferric-dicitrate binding protein FerR (iron transport regulator)